MKVTINEDLCISCGACQATAPEVFEVEDVAKVIVTEIKKEQENDVIEASEGCPTEAIIIE